MHTCPNCNGQKLVKNPDGSLWQKCPYCEGTGVDPGFETGPFFYKWQQTLTANQILLSQKITMNGVADFRLKLLTRKATGTFRIRMQDAAGRYLSQSELSVNDRVPDSCLFGDGQLPYVIVPHPVYSRNGYIGFDIEDTSGAGNTIELVLHGALIQYGG